MKRNRSALIALVVCFLAVFPILAAEPLWTLIPKKDDYQAFVDFCEILVDRRAENRMEDDADGYDFFSLLIDAKRDTAVLNLARAMLDADPNDSYYYAGRSMNPVKTAYLAGRIELMKRLIEVDPTLVQWEDMSDGGQGITPAAACVERDDLVTLEYLVSKRADLKTLCVRFDRKGAPFFASNLLTISRSKRMTDYLLSKGVPDFFKIADFSTGDSALMARCATGSVNLRKSPSPTAPAQARIKKGESFEVLGFSLYDTKLGIGASRWVLVKYDGKEGWIFGSAIEWDVADYLELPWSGYRTMGSMEDW